MRLVVVTAVTAIGLTACATLPEMNTREEFLAETTKTYHGETKERVIKAAELTVRSTGAGNLDFRHAPDGFTAFRPYVLYLVVAAKIGREKWAFATTERPNQVLASISLSDEGETITSTGPSRTDVAAKHAPVYRLFWKRMDYFLGRTADWPSCQGERRQLEAAGVDWSYLNPLCPTQEDELPPSPLPAKR
jgi:hypothetical protein